MSEPLVHVLVINWNGRVHLDECFSTLLKSDYRNVRFVLVDNASTDDSVEFVRSNFGHDERVEILNCPGNLGWSRGNNVGLEDALERGADYVFLLNNDTATEPGAIRTMVEVCEADKNIGSLAPKILLYDNPLLLNSIGLEMSIVGAAWDRGLGRLDAPRWDDVRAVAGVCGAAWFIRTNVLKKTGLLPTDFDIYLDDLDLCLRIWNAGYTVMTCPGAVVRHKFSATMGEGKQARRKYYLNTRNRLRIIKRNFPLSKTPQAAWAFVIGEGRAIGRAALNGEYWRVWAHVRSWGAAAAYVPRIWSERLWRRRAHFAECRFWPLVRTDRYFFAGTEFPEDGWYAPRTVNGTRVRPMTARAIYEHSGGTLRVQQVNCYPQIGPSIVRLYQGDSLIKMFQTTSSNEDLLELEPGTMEFVAESIFEAEDTGELIDIGGWLAVNSVDLEDAPE